MYVILIVNKIFALYSSGKAGRDIGEPRSKIILAITNNIHQIIHSRMSTNYESVKSSKLKFKGDKKKRKRKRQGLIFDSNDQ